MRYALMFLLSSSLLGACEKTPIAGDYEAKALSLETLWDLKGLDAPESVIPSADGSFLYVSNVNGDGDAKDGNGYIARISTDGGLIESKWVTGLDGPKGLARDGNRLYVSDITQLVSIDVQSGEIIDRFPAEGAGFLNDTVLTDQGIFVSDSATARIYHLVDGALKVFAEDEQLKGINGLWPHKGNLLITTMSGGELLSMDMVSKGITVIAGGMPDADSIAVLPDGSYFTSAWPGQLFQVSKDGTVRELLNTREDKIFHNDAWLEGETLYIPHWEPGSLSAHKLVWK